MGYEDKNPFLEKISLKDGDVVYFKDDKLREGFDPQCNRPYAEADSFVAGKNGPQLEAWGGGCRVISFYNKQTKVGAIIHVAVEDRHTKKHEDLIDELTKIFLESRGEDDVCVCGDKEGLENDFPNERDSYLEWNSEIIDYLRRKGFKNITEINEQEGKMVCLDTAAGALEVFDDDHNLIVEKKYEI